MTRQIQQLYVKQLLLCVAVLFCLGVHKVYAQKTPPEKVMVKGFVVDNETYEDLEGVHVYSTSGYGAITDRKGFFQIKVLLHDTLYFSRIEFERKSLTITDSTQLNDIVIALERKTYMLDSIEVRASYMADSFLLREKREPVYIPGVTKKIDTEKDYKMGVAGAVSSPVTAIYRAFSKQYKAEKKAHQLKKAKSRREDLKSRAYERLDKYTEIYDAHFDHEDYDKLVDRCNMGLQRILNSNDYDLFLWIDDCVKAYLADRNEGY